MNKLAQIAKSNNMRMEHSKGQALVTFSSTGRWGLVEKKTESSGNARCITGIPVLP